MTLDRCDELDETAVYKTEDESNGEAKLNLYYGIVELWL
jgi:hypothetical protein